MNKKKIKILMIGGIILTVTIGSFYIGTKLNYYKQIPHTANIIMENENTFRYKLDEKAIIDTINDSLELNILNVQLRQRLTIKGNNTDLSWFKNRKHIEYTGHAKYYLDFSNLNENAVKINENKIIINLNNPVINLDIDQSKIKYEDEKGWLSFYDIKLDPEVAYQLEKTAKDNMKKQLIDDDYLNEAKEKANNKIQFILKTLTDNSYEININWI